MVLRSDMPSATGAISAWSAVERRQRHCASSYDLVSQPDHAALAGALAGHFASPQFPVLEARVVEAIAAHDSGWAIFAAEANPTAAVPLDRSGKPISFMEIAVKDFLRAWGASINRAEEICPVGGIIVSTHFRRLGHYRLSSGVDEESAALLRVFDSDEEQRCRRLRPLSSASDPELAALVEVLQFCDLLSLYLCCGATEHAEFPQSFAAGPVRVSCTDGAFRLQPSPFQRDAAADPINVCVNCTRYDSTVGRTSLPPRPFILW